MNLTGEKYKDMSELNKVHISSGALVIQGSKGQKKILIMYRKESDSWHLPKGTQNNGETLEETCIREVKEETGVLINIKKYLGKLHSVTPKKISKETHYFLAEPVEINLSLHDTEHDIVDFFEIDIAYNLLKKKSLFEKEYEIVEDFAIE